MLLFFVALRCSCFQTYSRFITASILGSDERHWYRVLFFFDLFYNIIKQHFRNLSLLKWVESSLKEGNSRPTKPSRLKNIWLKSSSLAVSKSVLRLFVNPIGFCLHTKEWPRVSRFWKFWLSQ